MANPSKGQTWQSRKSGRRFIILTAGPKQVTMKDFDGNKRTVKRSSLTKSYRPYARAFAKSTKRQPKYGYRVPNMTIGSITSATLSSTTASARSGTLDVAAAPVRLQAIPTPKAAHTASTSLWDKLHRAPRLGFEWPLTPFNCILFIALVTALGVWLAS